MPEKEVSQQPLMLPSTNARTPPPIPPKPPSIRARRIRQRARLSVASHKSKTRSLLSDIDWSDGQSTPVAEHGKEYESRDNYSAVNGSKSIGGMVGSQSPPEEPIAELPPRDIVTPQPDGQASYFPPVSAILSPPLTEPSTPGSPGLPAPLRRHRSSYATSWHSSIFRRSMASTNLTTEEALLTNVFAGQLSPTIAETLLENEAMEVVPMYEAMALYDYHPEDDEEMDMVRFDAGERVKVFGKRNVRSTVLATPDVGEDWCWEREVEVSEGWCQVQVNGNVGFAPLAYLQFASDTTPLEVQSEIELALAEAERVPNETLSMNDPSIRRHNSYESLASHKLVESFLSTPREPSITTSLNGANSQLTYPSSMTVLSTGAVAITGKVRSGLKRLFRSWFAGNSVHDFIEGKNAVENDEESGGNCFTDDDEDSLRRTSVASGVPGVKLHDKHFITPGPAWAGSNPAFIVTVQSPQRRRKVSIDDAYSGSNTIVDEFVSYRIVSWFPDDVTNTSTLYPLPSMTYSTLTVDRRYTDFEWLHNHLLSRFPPPVLVVPQLPKKKYLNSTKRFHPDHVEERRRALERYLNCLARHPVLRSEEVVMLFLGCGAIGGSNWSQEDLERVMSGEMYGKYGDGEVGVVVEDEEWANGMKQYDAEHPNASGPADFFKRVHLLQQGVLDHPHPNLMDRFSTHLNLIDDHLEPLVESSQQHQSLMSDMHDRYQEIADALEVLARGRADEGRLMRNLSWCWKRGCFDCHEFSGNMLAISKHLHGIAEVYENHAQSDLCVFNERIRDFHGNINGYQGLSQLADLAETRYEEVASQNPTSRPSSSASSSFPSNERTEGMKKRLNRILTVAQAEVQRLHEEKQVEWEEWMEQWIDGQISAQEKILQHLKAAKSALKKDNGGQLK